MRCFVPNRALPLLVGLRRHYIAAENLDEAYDKLKPEIIDEWDQVEDVETLDEYEL